MKERPILMNAFSVRAILDGRKSQTRRVIKPSPVYGDDGVLRYFGKHPFAAGHRFDRNTDIPDWMLKDCPYGCPGDRLWVRETWRTIARYDSLKPSQIPKNARLWYEAGGERGRIDIGKGINPGKTRPSIFMPRRASRITLEVTGVRVERVQEITKEDAILEGIEPNWVGTLEGWDSMLHGYMNYNLDRFSDMEGQSESLSAVESFASLWDSINADRGFSWESNPWAWVLEFGVVATR